MTASYKNPPRWEDDQSFESWKAEMELWTSLMYLKPEQIGPAVALSLSGYRRSVVMKLDQAEFKGAGGFTKVLQELESVWPR